MSQIRRSDFPSDFVFGSATSAYQIEGGALDGGRGLSIWDTFSLDTPAKIVDGSNGNVAAQQYYMFKDDVKLMKKTGLDAYRFSISWSRILPGGKLCTGVNKEGIKFYNDLIDAIIAAGMQPYATLFHWDLPLALELEYGGFMDKKIVDDFRDFAELCFWEFGDRVKYWITVNEAWTYVIQGYVSGVFPPCRGSPAPREVEKHTIKSLAKNRNLSEVLDNVHNKENLMEQFSNLNELIPLSPSTDIIEMISNNEDIGEFKEDLQNELGGPIADNIVEYVKDITLAFFINYKTSQKPEPCLHGDPGREPYVVAHNILLAHAAAVDIYRKQFQATQGGKIGMTNNAIFFLPYNEGNEEDKKAAARALDFILYWFVAPLVTGKYPQSMRERVKDRLPHFTPEETKLVQGSYDFLGVNYYTSYYATHVPIESATPHYDHDQELLYTPQRKGVPIGPKGGSDWMYVYPPGICGLLTDMKKNCNDPLIFITENGVGEKTNNKQNVCQARHDQMRVDYHREHLIQVKKAITEGVNVKAYFIWSFADNYEWADGYCVRFGIFYVDFLNGLLTRHPKSSALWWMKFLTRQVNDISQKRIGSPKEISPKIMEHKEKRRTPGRPREAEKNPSCPHGT